jgi:replicative DNA helicase
MNNSTNSQHTDRILEMSAALTHLRDLWINLSLIFKDYLAEMDSSQRDKVLIEVERHLSRLRAQGRKSV